MVLVTPSDNDTGATAEAPRTRLFSGPSVDVSYWVKNPVVAFDQSMLLRSPREVESWVEFGGSANSGLGDWVSALNKTGVAALTESRPERLKANCVSTELDRVAG